MHLWPVSASRVTLEEAAVRSVYGRGLPSALKRAHRGGVVAAKTTYGSADPAEPRRCSCRDVFASYRSCAAVFAQRSREKTTVIDALWFGTNSVKLLGTRLRAG